MYTLLGLYSVYPNLQSYVPPDKIVKSPWFLYSYLYSMTSLLGVAVLLVCTPLGLSRIFSVIGGIVMKPQV